MRSSISRSATLTPCPFIAVSRFAPFQPTLMPYLQSMRCFGDLATVRYNFAVRQTFSQRRVGFVDVQFAL